jgi:ATP-binding cassette subfamily B protein
MDDEKEQRPESISVSRMERKLSSRRLRRKLIGFLWPHRRTIILAAILSVLTALSTLGQPLLVQKVIDDVGDFGKILPWILILLGLVVVGSFTEAVQQYLLNRTAERFVLDVRTAIIRRLFSLRMSEYDARSSGDLISRAASDSTLLRVVITSGLLDLLGSAIIGIGAAIALIWLDAVLFGLIVVVVLLAALMIGAVGRRIQSLTLDAQRALGQMTAKMQRGLSAIRTLRAANATEIEIQHVVTAAQASTAAGTSLAFTTALISPVNRVATQVAFLVVVGLGGYRVASGIIELSTLITFILFLFMLVMPIGQAVGAYSSLQNALGSFSRIDEILQLPTEDSDGDEVQTAVKSVHGLGITFEDVHFSYDALSPTLDGMSLTIAPGSLAAIVGPSGAGKSTMFSLLERFYEPSSGDVLVGEQSIYSLRRSELRDLIAYVEQSSPVMGGTLRDNLLVGVKDASDDECHEVLSRVRLDAVLRRTPDGLDSAVGENGLLLSGGERQRLAIARALLADKPIVLMDEPTSSLDGINEEALKQSIREASNGRTTVIIAHRLSTVVDADVIFVVDNGHVVASGTHVELLATCALYKDLAKSMNSGREE